MFDSTAMQNGADAAPSMRKTWKREVASLLLFIVVALQIAGIWVPEAHRAAESLQMEVFGFAALAFGMDAWAKQVQHGRGAAP
jgi:hypothetical protein